MPDIIVFNKSEEAIIEHLESSLKRRGLDDVLEAIENNKNALYDLSRSISLYPSVFKQESLGNESRSIDTLVNNLCIKDIVDLIFNIPTKAILGQGFYIAKINFFYMLLYLSREKDDLKHLNKYILEILKSNIYNIMAEEVFIAIVSDKAIDFHIRSRASFLLANIWEYRLYQGVSSFVPILDNIWNAREKVKPAYGTLIGISELFSLTEKTDPMWLDFLTRDELQEDEIDSLQEFLIGLSYEEMKILSESMKANSKASINKDEIESVLGAKTQYPQYNISDPRNFFKFFTNRKNNALFRRRGDTPGPKKTIEEYIMCYLLSRDDQWIPTQ